jgi:hypothetical protein
MAAPIRKVAPNSFITGPLAGAIGKAESAFNAADAKPIHDSLSAFGVIVSSTAPGALHRAATYRYQIRRLIALG